MVLEELLAPAGSYDVLVIAVNAGADAFYIAGQNYGARAYAKNFTMEEIEKAVEYAEEKGGHSGLKNVSPEVLEILKISLWQFFSGEVM